MKKFNINDYLFLFAIDENGKAYDEHLNEYRTEEGNILYIPKRYWKHFKKLENI